MILTLTRMVSSFTRANLESRSAQSLSLSDRDFLNGYYLFLLLLLFESTFLKKINHGTSGPCA